ncbi:MAG TPA: dienelactone hydrolase family protein [Candidatus Binatia bacterium]
MITRREFLQQSVLATGSLAAGKLLVDTLAPVSSDAAQIDPNDPGLISSEVKYSSTDGTAISAYVTRPKGSEAHPAVLVIHEWDGIKEHIRDVARRLAKSGYAALAPDLLSRYGGTSSFSTQEAAIAAGRKLDDDSLTNDLSGAVSYLKGQSFVRANRIGVIGFCWGGGKALLFTTRSKDLSASVIYYGSNPSNLEDVKNISAPVLGQYGGEDERITSAVPKLDKAMKQYGKSFEYNVYPGAPHAFNSDVSPSYREDAAKEAWTHTLEFFKTHLQS